jgi:hypothetical protein
MSRCDLEILVEESNRVFRFGETIRGRVIVDVDQDCRCDGLSVRGLWRTHGRGNQNDGWGERIQLFQGQWSAGDELVYTFEFKIPIGPSTYHGHLINIDWYLEASADIPWAFEPKTEVELFVGPGDRVSSGSERVASVEDSNAFSKGLVFGFPHEEPSMLSLFTKGFDFWNWGFLRQGRLGCGCAFIMCFMGFVIYHHWEQPKFRSFLAFCVILGIAGVVQTLRVHVQNRFAQKKIGEVEFSIEPTEVVGGEALICRLTFEPGDSVRVDRIQLCLTGEEEVVSGTWSSATTHTHTLHEELFDMLEVGTQYTRGPRVELEEEIPVPVEAAPSFRFTYNQVFWTVDLRIVIPGWPDFNVSRRFHVLD